MITVHWSLFSVHCSMFTVHSLLITVYWSLFTVQCSLITVPWSLINVHCLYRNFRRTFYRNGVEYAHRLYSKTSCLRASFYIQIEGRLQREFMQWMEKRVRLEKCALDTSNCTVRAKAQGDQEGHNSICEPPIESMIIYRWRDSACFVRSSQYIGSQEKQLLRDWKSNHD